jgi:hypothetical protein
VVLSDFFPRKVALSYNLSVYQMLTPFSCR